MGVESGGDGGTRPRSEEVRRGRPSRFENEVAQIRCLFRFLVYFGGRLDTLPTIRPPTHKFVAAPLNTGERLEFVFLG